MLTTATATTETTATATRAVPTPDASLSVLLTQIKSISERGMGLMASAPLTASAGAAFVSPRTL